MKSVKITEVMIAKMSKIHVMKCFIKIFSFYTDGKVSLMINSLLQSHMNKLSFLSSFFNSGSNLSTVSNLSHIKISLNNGPTLTSRKL